MCRNPSDLQTASTSLFILYYVIDDLALKSMMYNMIFETSQLIEKCSPRKAPELPGMTLEEDLEGGFERLSFQSDFQTFCEETNLFEWEAD